MDPARALDQVMGDEEPLLLVAQSFVDTVPPFVDTLEQSASMGDFESAHRAAHSLKGLAPNLADDELAAIAYRAEAALLDQSETGTVDLASTARSRARHLQAALDAMSA